ncbi:MraY family glycosyltransferase [Inhella proteolytica]|uniref:Glycosyltransferase family 4 protein n=1 Tax=Inhella proteolytica TaxID=2795029 RepID=A0A931NHP6_9BURK|nr:glycosyltransferase [Inhella proteolytica]MBH9577998.1 glycosyltransferase family 4 protein [Inhella proteolytica]
MEALLAAAALGLLVAALGALLIVRSARLHAWWSADHDFSGPQKFHGRAVPRIGGLALWAGFVAACAVWLPQRPEHLPLLGGLLLFSLPVLGGGLWEDLTKRISPRRRMALLAVGALAAAWGLEATIIRTDIPGLDWVAAWPAGAVLLALFVVLGVSNAINIIDGFNGLASMCSVIMLAGLGAVALQVGDGAIAGAALLLLAATLGLFLLNYPLGLIFLGDGGAYFLGFMLSELGILLLVRNPQVSPLFPLLLCAYPVVETLFSMYRRRVLRGRPMAAPDGVHLHSLIYRRLVRWAVGSRDARELLRRNSLTAPYLWVACALAVLPAVLFWRSSAALGICLLLYAGAYVSLYWRIVRFRAPRWLVRRPVLV